MHRVLGNIVHVYGAWASHVGHQWDVLVDLSDLVWLPNEPIQRVIEVVVYSNSEALYAQAQALVLCDDDTNLNTELHVHMCLSLSLCLYVNRKRVLNTVSVRFNRCRRTSFVEL